MKKVLVVLLTLAMALAFTACGNDGNGGNGNTGEPDNQGQEFTEEEIAAVKEKVLHVGTNPDFPPYEFTDPETGDITGFDIDLLEAIAADQGLTLEWTALGFDGLVAAVQTGNIDIAASGITIDDKRKEMVAFTESYINSGLAIAVRDGDDAIQGVEDLEGKKAAVQIGTTGYAKAQELLDEGVLTDVVILNTVDVVMQELINEGVDCVINDYPVTEKYIIQQPGKIKIVGEPLTSEDYGFAVAKENSVLLHLLNEGLKNVKTDGTYDALLEKYFEEE